MPEAPIATAPSLRRLQPTTRRRLVWLFGIASVLHVGAALASTCAAGIPLSHLGAYFDGHLYIEIAKSFPLPFAPEARAYLGHAPGYPALIALVHGLTPDSLLDWGGSALVATWLPGALAPCAFYLLCREAGVEPFWPSVFFIVGNPRWLPVGANPHAEPLAMLLLLLCLLAYLRRRLAWSVVLLAAAALCRFPVLLLLGAMAVDLLILRRRRELRTIPLLGVPLLVFALYNLYLVLRVPGSQGVWAEHAVFWAAELTWPFKSVIAAIEPRWWRSGALYALTYLSLIFYLTALFVGLRPSQRHFWILPLWIGTLVGLHVSLEGLPGVWDLTRLVILAWPAALVVLWSFACARIPSAAAAAACVLFAVVGLSWGVVKTVNAIEWQGRQQWFLADVVQRLDSDQPRWLVIEDPPRASVP